MLSLVFSEIIHKILKIIQSNIFLLGTGFFQSPLFKILSNI